MECKSMPTKSLCWLLWPVCCRVFSWLQQWRNSVVDHFIWHRPLWWFCAASHWVSSNEASDIGIRLNFETYFLIWIPPGVYGFILLPTGWSSFGDHTPETYAYIRQTVGNYSYLALALILLMQFSAKFGVYGLPNVYNSESFPMKWGTDALFNTFGHFHLITIDSDSTCFYSP